MQLTDTDLGIGSAGRPGEVTVARKIIQGKYRSVRKGEKPSAESTEPKSKILRRQLGKGARHGDGSRVASWEQKQRKFKRGSEKLSDASESSKWGKKCPLDLSRKFLSPIYSFPCLC